jgi:hypothetical protein
MSFQWVLDNATTLSVNRLDTVGSTQARDGTIKATSRGTPKKIFTVQLPDGPKWSDIKSNIAAAEALDRHTTATMTIDYSVHDWYYGFVDPGVAEESYTVICVQFPQWTVFGYDQVRWDGPFVFVEV